MILSVALTALVVREYDEAKEFYCGVLGFTLVEDTPLSPEKRWVRLRAPGGQGSEILLARADDDRQRASIGNQAGGRVGLFFYTDDFAADYEKFKAKGVKFTEGPWDRDYGRVAVFLDLYGNRIDLIEPKK